MRSFAALRMTVSITVNKRPHHHGWGHSLNHRVSVQQQERQPRLSQHRRLLRHRLQQRARHRRHPWQRNWRMSGFAISSRFCEGIGLVRTDSSLCCIFRSRAIISFCGCLFSGFRGVGSGVRSLAADAAASAAAAVAATAGASLAAAVCSMTSDGAGAAAVSSTDFVASPAAAPARSLSRHHP